MPADPVLRDPEQIQEILLPSVVNSRVDHHLQEGQLLGEESQIDRRWELRDQSPPGSKQLLGQLLPGECRAAKTSLDDARLRFPPGAAACLLVQERPDASNEWFSR